MRIKIVQHLFQPFQFQLVGWNKFCKIILVFAENHTENFTEKPLDLQLITEGLLIKEGTVSLSFWITVRVHELSEVRRMQGTAEFWRKGRKHLRSTSLPYSPHMKSGRARKVLQQLQDIPQHRKQTSFLYW